MISAMSVATVIRSANVMGAVTTNHCSDRSTNARYYSKNGLYRYIALL
jgi:hypothetical protein